MIDKYEFYNGIVLNSLINFGSNIMIQPGPCSSANSFCISNNKVGIYIKKSEKRSSPWRFTFKKTHQEEIYELSKLVENVFIILVCFRDGIVNLEYKTLKKVLDDEYDENEWISASRLSRQQYQVTGSNGKLKHKVPINAFPKKIFEVLQ